MDLVSPTKKENFKETFWIYGTDLDNTARAQNK